MSGIRQPFHNDQREGKIKLCQRVLNYVTTLYGVQTWRDNFQIRAKLPEIIS